MKTRKLYEESRPKARAKEEIFVGGLIAREKKLKSAARHKKHIGFEFGRKQICVESTAFNEGFFGYMPQLLCRRDFLSICDDFKRTGKQQREDVK